MIAWQSIHENLSFQFMMRIVHQFMKSQDFNSLLIAFGMNWLRHELLSA